ncbi:SpoIIE family protein phosphatase [Eubacterium sp.]|uniref:SpoIIE family protein phosphatase n=1 Tax=Eubacterium sp. TaxID=142586 RepID=UPI0025E36793|nr:SpoIIE family protein phosphatase [Eubacterium sp.]MCR5628608.1 SpoIIE family protein phosphatase [Eubacterium sp.]
MVRRVAKRLKQIDDKRIVIVILMQLVIILSFIFLGSTDRDRLNTSRIFSIAFDIAGMLVGEVILICSIIDDAKHTHEDLMFFTSILVVTFVLLFLDETAWLVDGVENYRTCGIVINTCYYALGQFLALIFWNYVVSTFGGQRPRLSKISKIINVAFAIEVLSIILNAKFGYYFSVNEYGFYHRESFNFIAYMYAHIVLVISFLVIIRNKSLLDFHQIVAMMVYVILPFVVSIIMIFLYEFSVLYASVMLATLVMYCMLNVSRSKATARSEYDLHLAAKIQSDALPKEFPAFPNRNEFDLFACMIPARDIGGDFYDFFMIDDDRLALVIADVSGKGMPAALFMMAAKNLIKSVCRIRRDTPAQILETVNRQLCDGNEESFFITVWFGILTISSGELQYANAGHEHPAICRKGASYNLKKEKHSLPLAVDKDTMFYNESIRLNKGDKIYLYTDGVTDSRNENGVLFGEKRLLEALNRETNIVVDKVVENVLGQINGFINNAIQHDDITMLILQYNGSFSINKFEADNVTSLKIEATRENWELVMNLIKDRLTFYDCPKGIANQIYIAAEEIYVNIASYAYPDREGMAVVITDYDEETKEFSIRFVDAGIKYNPLKKEDPNTDLTAKQRRIGGLGIFMVKKIMDSVSYEHKGGNNIFVMKKNIKE